MSKFRQFAKLIKAIKAGKSMRRGKQFAPKKLPKKKPTGLYQEEVKKPDWLKDIEKKYKAPADKKKLKKNMSSLIDQIRAEMAKQDAEGLDKAALQKLKKSKPKPPKKKVRTYEEKLKKMKKDLPPPRGTPEYEQWKRDRQNAIYRGNLGG